MNRIITVALKGWEDNAGNTPHHHMSFSVDAADSGEHVASQISAIVRQRILDLYSFGYFTKLTDTKLTDDSPPW
jgi:hypothetical protein